MKGIRAYEIGGPDVLKYEDMPEPTPAAGEAVVTIRNIGVNYTECPAAREPIRRPRSPGPPAEKPRAS